MRESIFFITDSGGNSWCPWYIIRIGTLPQSWILLARRNQSVSHWRSLEVRQSVIWGQSVSHWRSLEVMEVHWRSLGVIGGHWRSTQINPRPVQFIQSYMSERWMGWDWMGWLGKPLFEMFGFYIGISQIALESPPLSNRRTWKKKCPKPLWQALTPPGNVGKKCPKLI